MEPSALPLSNSTQWGLAWGKLALDSTDSCWAWGFSTWRKSPHRISTNHVWEGNYTREGASGIMRNFDTWTVAVLHRTLEAWLCWQHVAPLPLFSGKQKWVGGFSKWDWEAWKAGISFCCSATCIFNRTHKLWRAENDALFGRRSYGIEKRVWWCPVLTLSGWFTP